MNPFTVKAVVLFSCTVVSLMFILPQSMAKETEQQAAFGHQAVPNDQLAKEHDITLQVAGAAEEVARRLESGEQVEKEKLVDLHDFFVNFVDACHHAKEEQYYFPVALVARPHLQEIVSALKRDHDIGKALLTGVAAGLKLWEHDHELARRQAADNLVAYSALLHRHIDVESAKMMASAKAAFSQEQEDLVRKGFHYVESEQLGAGFHEKYHALAMKILGKK